MMRSGLALTLAAATGWAVAAPATAPAAPASAPPLQREGAAACERAAQQTLRDTRGANAAASFSAPPTALPGAADAGQITWRGAGQVRTATGLRPFSYSCNYDTQNAAVTGVVLRDTGAPERTPQPRSVEPDLSHVSPVACESAAASALKTRWPNVTQVSFNADTRQLSQDTSGTAHLRGQGSARPSLREPATYFGYDCQIDARNGRVLGLRIAD
jgi:hypothetical protein